jgi:hypothetical protein
MSVAREMQSVFRAANERLRSRLEDLTYRGRRPVICECSDPECMEVLELTRAQYRQVREQGNFVIARGHVTPEVEHVVESTDDYDVVRKD